MPDLQQEALRRRQRDILLNWSRKIIGAASGLSGSVGRENWVLYTRLRPFFITADDPATVSDTIDRLFAARNLEDVLFEFREELARLDESKADAIIDAAREDLTPGIVEYQSLEEIAENMRAYLEYQRQRIAVLREQGSSPNPAQVTSEAKLLAWRGAMLLANQQPWWYVRGTSLTLLASRPDLGFYPHVADPRGMFTGIVEGIPGMYAQIPYSLTGDHQTGLCIAPARVAAAATQVAGWTAPLPLDPAPSEVELRAVREALVYAQTHGMGLWEATDLAAPELDILPIIGAGQGATDETMHAPAASSGFDWEPTQAYGVPATAAAPSYGDSMGMGGGLDVPEADAIEAPAPALAKPAGPPPFWAKFLPQKADGGKPAKAKPAAKAKPVKEAKPKPEKPAKAEKPGKEPKEKKPIVLFGKTLGGK